MSENRRATLRCAFLAWQAVPHLSSQELDLCHFAMGKEIPLPESAWEAIPTGSWPRLRECRENRRDVPEDIRRRLRGGGSGCKCVKLFLSQPLLNFSIWACSKPIEYTCVCEYASAPRLNTEKEARGAVPIPATRALATPCHSLEDRGEGQVQAGEVVSEFVAWELRFGRFWELGRVLRSTKSQVHWVTRTWGRLGISDSKSTPCRGAPHSQLLFLGSLM